MRFEEWMSRHFPTLPANWAIKLWDDAQPENMLHARAQLEQEWASLKAMQRMAQNPIDMVLYCPACGTQHIDAPAPAPGAPKYFENTGPDDRFTPPWNNPPHRSHLCAACGVQWRPADVPTNGVAKLKTAGQNDTPVIRSLKEISDEYNWVRNVLAEERGYNGPLSYGHCPLPKWLKEPADLRQQVEHLEATCEALSERISRPATQVSGNETSWGEGRRHAPFDGDRLVERTAQLIAHRACTSGEHNPGIGMLHGCCVICCTPWPCEYAGEPPASDGPQGAKL